MSLDDVQKDLTALRKRRGVIKGSLTRMKKFVNDFETSDQQISLLEFRQDELPQINKKYDDVQSQIELLSEETEVEEIERETFENDYFDIRSKIQEIINIGRTNNSTSNSSSSNSVPWAPNRARLPPITIPEFDGNLQNWEPYYDCFRSMIHEDSSYTAIQKFYYLRAGLSGQALDLVKSVPMTDANYEVAVQLLKQRYDNQGLVIQSHIRSLLEAPYVENPSSTELQALHSHIGTHLASLKALKQPTEHWDAWLVTIIVSRLDSVTSHSWQLSQQHTLLPKYEDLERFLATRCIAIENSEVLSTYTGKLNVLQQSTNARRKTNTISGAKKVLAASKSPTDEKCVYCTGIHRLYMCNKFKDIPPSDRVSFVREKRLCYNCLSPYHKIDSCKSRFVCQKCRRRHNTIIHLEQQEKLEQNSEEVLQPNSSSKSPEELPKVSCAAQYENAHVFLATAIVFVTDNFGNKRKCRVVLDSGSQINFISKRLVNLLQLPRKSASLLISGIGAKQSHAASYLDINVQSRTSDYQVELSCYVLSNMVTDLAACVEPKGGWRLPADVLTTLADPEFHKRRSVDLLIGGGTFFDILCAERRIIDKGPLCLQNSKFGWIVTGELGITCLLGINSVGEGLEEEWQSEENDEFSKYGRLSKANQRSIEEEETAEYFRQTTSRDMNGRFIVHLPKKSIVKNLGASRTMATSRFLSVERRLQGDEKLKTEYTAFMDDYIKMGHAREVIGETSIPEPSFYLPHHAVIKASSLTTKVRVVFDASAKSSSGLSLNDVLKCGPTVQEDVFGILARFRKFQYVITSDVEKMFRQVQVAKEDWNLQRIVWRSNPNELLRTYQLTTVTYGTTPASFLATQCLVSLAEEERHTFPQAARAILHDFYMDDLMTGADTIEECAKLQREINFIMDSGKLPLRKWCSNSLSIMKLIGKREHDPLFSLEIGDQETVKSLGLEWKPLVDQFFFTISTVTRKKRLTKRMLLSDLNKIFDPLGLLTPVLVKGKIFLQQMWAIKMGWDTQLSDEMQNKWIDFYHTLEQLKCCIIPRKVIPEISNEVEMHGFCDASEQAYGACVYVRSKDSSGKWHSRLLCAKTRVAPLKGATIPRLELNGARLLAELVNKVAESWMVSVRIFRLWTDSMIVLSWLNSQGVRLKTFVLNRVCQILELTDRSQWRHVRTDKNPADIISRGITSSELIVAEEWWQGPKWMSTEEEKWSHSTAQLIETDQIPEQRQLKIALVTCDTINNIFNAHSNWNTLVRSVAWILRFIKYKKDKIIDSSKFLSVLELKNASLSIIKRLQEEAFHEEINRINTNKELRRGSKIRNLCPFMKDGLIRVGGRLENSNLDINQKHPIVIPANNRVTRLIFEDRHRMLCHCGPQSLLAEVRRTYWPLRGRIMARSVTTRCVQCIKAKPTFLQPLMAPLPEDRVQGHRPFAVCGVDFAGPMIIKSGLRRVTGSKAWIAVFVCFSTRAIHLEPVEDLSSSAFLACLRRFMARRGKCSKIYSDNGTNFVGAQKELASYMTGIDERMANEGIEWKFNPPAAPHFGGLWESAVKTTKFHLTRMMKETRLTLGELNTLLCQVEACINSRPITPLSSNPLDLEVLTPAHFLIGGPLFLTPEVDLTERSPNGLRRWKYVQYLMQSFWKRWEKEYLPQCQVRGKWVTNSRPLEIDDIVIIKGESAHPTKWKLGRITDLHPGKDQIIRVATVRTSNGTEMRRPTVKLCRLPIQEEDRTVEK